MFDELEYIIVGFGSKFDVDAFKLDTTCNLVYIVSLIFHCLCILIIYILFNQVMYNFKRNNFFFCGLKIIS